MYIENFQLRNYKGFRDSGSLHFTRGMNLVVGQNNVGKSSLLQSLRLNFPGAPHLSLATKPTRTSSVVSASIATVTLVTSGAEIAELLLNANQQFPFGLQHNTKPTPGTAQAELNELFATREVRLPMELRATDGGRSWRAHQFPADGRLVDDPNGPPWVALVSPRRDQGTFNVDSLRQDPGDYGPSLAEHLIRRIHFFHAERLQLASSNFGREAVLDEKARNLPEVLNNLQSNPALFRDLSGLVNYVIPSVRQVTVRSQQANQVEVLVWSHDPETRRDDLAASLIDCGSGVGQVLAILYVVLTSSFPRTILIDEPASFLNPGAARKLMSVLNDFSDHQYIVSTHSPEIIGFVRSAPVMLVKWDGSHSVIEQINPASMNDARRVLGELGAKLSDVYGADNVIWTEGPTEEECFPLIAKHFAIDSAGTIFLGVRDTGSFQKKDKQATIDLYRRLSDAGSLLPPAIAFVFDRDNLDARAIEDMERLGVTFLRRRMYENYLLHPAAITAVLNTLPTFRDAPASLESVEEQLNERLRMDSIEVIDGASILTKLFEDLSGAREKYEKVQHGAAITQFLLANDPDQLSDIHDLLRSIFHTA